MHTHTRASSPATPSSPADAEAILAWARELALATEAGPLPPFLRGMNLGLLGDAEASEGSRLFERAATALGARVTAVVANFAELGAAGHDSLMKTARILGRLYDGLECQGMEPALVERLRRTAGVPVFNGLAMPGHATAALADKLAGSASTDVKRLLILQGSLLFALLNHAPASGSLPPEQAP
jgi:ornithine carbamoyltransferase